MKKSELVVVKGLDLKELKQKAVALKKEIAELTMNKNIKKLKDLKSISKKRKDLAQVLTILGQKEQLSVLSGQLSEKSQPVVSKSDKQKTDNRKGGNKS